MSDVNHYLGQVGLLPGKGKSPFDIEPEQEYRPIPMPSLTVDQYLEGVGLEPSAMYKRRKGPIPEPPDIEDPTISLMRLLASSDDPVKELAKINTARYISQSFKLDPGFTYANLEKVSEHWLGKIVPPPVLAQSLRDAWDNGMQNYNLSKLALQLRETGGEDEELVKQIRDIESAMKPLADIPRPWIQNAMLWAAESSPLMAQSFLRGGVTGAATGAAAGVMYGAVGAPLTGGLSVPAMTLAMASVGFAVGSTQAMIQSMRGLAYWRMREMQVPHNIAAPLSDIEGVIEGAIESLGNILIGVKIPGLTPALQSAGALIANKMMVTGVIPAIATRLVGQVVGAGLGEGIEEPLQELTAIFTDQLARELSKDKELVAAFGREQVLPSAKIPALTLENLVERTGQAFYTGMSAGLVFGMVGAPGGITADVRRLSAIRTLAAKMPTKSVFVDTIMAADYLPAEGTGVSPERWREYLGKVWDTQQRKAAEVKAEPKPTMPTAAPPAPGVAPEEAAAAPEEYRTAEGLIHTQQRTVRQTKEGTSELLMAGNPTTGERYGYISYETVGGRVYIDQVVNETKRDLRREMILDLASRFAGREIEWNPIEETEIELRESIISRNPRGPQFGLQWFAAPEVAAARAEVAPVLTRDIFTRRMGQLFNAPPEQAEYYGHMADVFAKNAGMSTDEWLRQYIAPEVEAAPEAKERLAAGGGVAGTAFVAEGVPVSPLQVDLEEFKGRVKAVFSALEQADFHTGVHEFFHAVERLALSPRQVGLFEEALGKLRGTWTEADIEMLATRFEDYLATGKAPTPELLTLFQEIAKLLREIVSFIKERAGRGVVALSPEFEKAYDALFVRPDSGLTKAETAAQVEEQAVEPGPLPAPTVSVAVQETLIAPEVAVPEPAGATTLFDFAAIPVVEIPVADVALSEEVPNFKEGAGARGVIEQLQGEKYERLGTAPIVLWERLTGRLEVITGRHRLDLAQRVGEPTLPAQIVREREGFTAVQAMTFDAESNIRDGQGSVRDYANYFRNTEAATEAQASSRGLLSRDKGRKGFAIGKYATDGLYALYRAHKIAEAKAAAIAATALGDERLQNLGILKIKELSAEELTTYLTILKTTGPTTAAGQVDMFGMDESFMIEAATMAKEAAKKMGELRGEFSALNSALKLSVGERGKILEKYGFKPGDVNAVRARVAELETEILGWSNWTTDPAKHEELRKRSGLIPGLLFHPSPPVESEEFQRWFGESTVVDERQNPKPMYHGTHEGGFTSFQRGDMGMHFGTLKQAEYFAGGITPPGAMQVRFPSIYPVYLRAQNPIRLRDIGNWSAFVVMPQLVEMGFYPEDRVYAIISTLEWDRRTKSETVNYANKDKPFTVAGRGDEAFGHYATREDAEKARKRAEQYRWNNMLTDDIIDLLKSKGYDGVVYLNRREGFDKTVNWFALPAGTIDAMTDEEFSALFPDAEDSVMVFDPNQVKSAYNVGTWDIGTAEMLFHPETPEFKEWFGDSKIVDEKGEPLKVFHGTPSAGFQSFKTGINYFSPDPSYAAAYIKQSTSAIVKPGEYYEREPAEGIYPVYLKIEKPFDTRNKKERTIFENEFLNKGSEEWQSNGTPLDPERGLPDWTDAEDLYAFIQEKGYDYDGLILAESHGRITFATFLPEQIKSVFNLGAWSVTEANILFHPAEWQGQLLYGTAIDAEIYQSYVEQARPFASAEEFRTEMVKQYGQLQEGDIAAEEATRFYEEVWQESRREKPVAAEPTVRDITPPEIKGAPEYDYGEKVGIARDLEPGIAGKVETGEVTEKELDKAAETAEQAAQKAEEQAGAVEAQATEALEGLTPEEQRIISLGDQLEAAINSMEAMPPETEKPTQARVNLQAKIDSLRERFEAALKNNLVLAETLLKEMMWTKAIITGEQVPGEEAVAAAGKNYKEAVRLGRDLQKAIDEQKAKGVAAKASEKLAATKAKLYAEKRRALESYKNKIKESQKAKRALKKYREARAKLISDIMRQPGRSVSFRNYAEVIREIQRGLDPKKRQKQTLYYREQLRRFLEQNPEAAPYVPKDRLQAAYTVSLGDMTMAQLEEIDQMIDALRKLGILKRSQELAREREMRENQRGILANTVLRGKELEPPVGGVKPTRKWLKAMLPTWKPDRIALLLDGGTPGAFTKWLQDEPNAAWAEMKKSIRGRMTPVLAKLNELKLTLDPTDPRRLTQGFSWLGESLDIDGFRYTNGKIPTVNDAMFWAIGIQNEKTRAALLFGNNLPEEVVIKGISMLTPNQRTMAEAIAADFEKNFPRLREAFIDIFNIDLAGESHYVPMRRLEKNYATRDEEVAAELTFRAGVRKQFIARNPTYERMEMADEHQKPIRTDLVGLWIEGVKVQEGFINQDKLVKRMHSIFESEVVRPAITQKYGPDMNKWISTYINDLAQADAYATQTALDRFLRISRTNAAVAWLAFNLLPNLKQLTGTVNYLADAGPIHLASAAAQFAAGKGKSVLQGKPFNNTMVDFVDERTELLRNRQISQEFDDLKRLNATLYQSIVKKIGTLGMKSLELIDKATVYIGWKAVYDRVLAKTGVEAEAIQAADRATIRTQPSSRVQDMAAMYRSGELLKWFTMFTSELSAIWNRLSFDVPMAIKRGDLVHALGDMVAFSLVGLGIAVASGGLQGDDDEKRDKLVMGLFSQYIESIPFFGNDIFATISGRQFGYGGVRVYPALQFLTVVPRQLANGTYDKAAGNLIKGLSFAVGLPVSGPTKAVKAIRSGELRDLLGWPKE